MSAEWDREEVFHEDEFQEMIRPAQSRPVAPEGVATSSPEEVFVAPPEAGRADVDDWEDLSPPSFRQPAVESAAAELPTDKAWSGPASEVELPRRPLGWNGKRQGRRLVRPDEVRPAFSPHERLLILDTWQRSGLPAGDFAPLVGLSKHTLYLWKKRFVQQGPAGLAERPRGLSPGSKLSEVTKRTIVMLKELHLDWGCQRISDELLRGPALAASAAAVARVLHEAGYQLEERVTRPHPEKVQRFERARPNQLWQTDLFTFVLKRQNRRLYLVGFMDDHSRFLVGYGLHASAQARWCWKSCAARSLPMVCPRRFSPTTVRNMSPGAAPASSAKNSSSKGFARWSHAPSIRKRWGRSSGFGGRCGGTVCSGRCSWTWKMLGSGSVYLLTITTSNVRTKGWTD